MGPRLTFMIICLVLIQACTTSPTGRSQLALMPESQLDAMDLGKEVAPSLAAEIDALAQDEKINAELDRLRSEVKGNSRDA